MSEENGTSDSLQLQNLFDYVATLLPQIALGLVVFLILWGLGVLLQRLIRRFFERRNLNRDVEQLVGQAVKLVFIALAIITGLGTMGVDVGGLVASVGLVGFAIGFALKDAISNTLAGILLLLYHPFERGDEVTIADFNGIVEDIDLRYTLLETPEKRILVPNQKLFTDVVTVQKPSSGRSPAKSSAH